jgi:hypothetical protein
MNSRRSPPSPSRNGAGAAVTTDDGCGADLGGFQSYSRRTLRGDLSGRNPK